MRKTPRAALVTALAFVILGSPALPRAQTRSVHPLDRIVRAGPVAVGPGISMAGSLHSVLRSVAVPFGFEQVNALSEYTVAIKRIPASKELKVSGLTLRVALDQVVATDPRYEWRFVNGVVVMRPIAAWNDSTHPLHRFVPPDLNQVSGGQAVDALKAATGHPGPPVIEFPRTHLFSVAFGGGRLIDLLDAIVRAHGEMAWSLTGSVWPSADHKYWTFRPSLSLSSPLGHGMAINGALLKPEASVPSAIFIRGEASPEGDLAATRDRLDLPLPPAVTQMHAKGVTHLAASLGVPSGFEEVTALKEFVSKPFRMPEGHLHRSC